MSQIQLIPLNKLVVSKTNVRKTDRKADLEPLAASISAHGLLQNLTVSAREDGKYAVEAGARRHGALKLLAQKGERAKDWPVPCVVIDAARAGEASLAENIQRVDMNAMDEVEAFAALIEGGATIDDVARRFGATVRHVEQRLALARLSARIRAAYRNGEINLDVARAFCLSDDHGAQERVFKGLPKPITNAHLVRNALTQGRIPATDRLAVFVGIERYSAAGGRIVQDLFEPDITFLEDGDVLQRLALEQAERLREEALSEGWGWAEIDLAHSHLQIDGCASERLRPTQRPFTAKEKRRLSAIESELESVDAKLETEDQSEESEALWSRRDALEAEHDAICDAARAYDKAQAALAGVAIGVGYDGKPQIARGLIRRSDLKALNKLRQQPSGTGEDETDAAKTPTQSLSKALVRDLTAARTLAVRARIASNPHVALAVLTCLFAEQNSGIKELAGIDIKTMPHTFENETIFTELKAAHAPPETLADFLALSTERLCKLLAPLVAETIDLSHEGASVNDRALQTSGDALARAVDLDMSAYWEADAEFWARTTRQFALDAWERAVFADLAAPKRTERHKKLAKLKKADFAKALAKEFAGKRWLPDCLVTPLAAGTLTLSAEGEAALAATPSA